MKRGNGSKGEKRFRQNIKRSSKTAPLNWTCSTINSIRMISPQIAIEEERAALVPQPPGENRLMSRYTAVHINQDGQWLMTDVRDTLMELPPDMGQLEGPRVARGHLGSQQHGSRKSNGNVAGSRTGIFVSYGQGIWNSNCDRTSRLLVWTRQRAGSHPGVFPALVVTRWAFGHRMLVAYSGIERRDERWHGNQCHPRSVAKN